MKKGTVLFIGGSTCISRLIRYFTNSKYSHTALYLGNHQILEADYDGVIISSLDKYVNNTSYYMEELDPQLTPTQASQFIDFVITKRSHNYDYFLLIGYLFFYAFQLCKKCLGFFNSADHWLCSELIAAGLKHTGVALPFAPAQMTPQNLYEFLKGRSDDNKTNQNLSQ